MASKKIEFILDVDSKPIDVAVDSTLNLSQAYREVQKELKKTKEGTKEFELLSTKAGDLKDQLEKTKVKSQDLFGSLQLLPGPVGEFSGQVNGAISSLKLFSSFSLKDLRFQFKESVNDIKDIVKNLLGLTVAEEAATVATEQQTVAEVANTVAIEADTVATEANTVAKKANIKAAGLIGLAIAAVSAAVIAVIANWDKLKERLSQTSEAEKALNKENEKLASGGYELVAQFETLSTKVLAAKNSIFLQKQAVVEYNSKFGDLLGKQKSFIGLQDMMTGPKFQEYKKYLILKAKAEADAFNLTELYKKLEQRKVEGEIEIAKKVLQLELAGGKGAELTIRRKNLKAEFDKELKDIENSITATTALLNENSAEAAAQANKLGIKPPEIKTDKPEDKVDKNLENIKKAQEKLREITNQNAVDIIEDKRKREDEQLIKDKEKEKKEIIDLELKDGVINGKKVKGAELTQQLLKAIDDKYAAKKTQLTNERNKEDEDKAKDLQEKLNAIQEAGEQASLDTMKEGAAKQIAQIEKDGKDKIAKYTEQVNELVKLNKLTQDEANKLISGFTANVQTAVTNATTEVTKKDWLEKFDENLTTFFAKTKNSYEDIKNTITTAQENLDAKFKAGAISQTEYAQRSIALENELVSAKERNVDATQMLSQATAGLAQAMGEESVAGQILTKISQGLALASTSLALANAFEGLGKDLKKGFPTNIIAVASTLGLMGTAISQFKTLFGKGPKDLTKGDTGSGSSGQNLGRNYGDGGMINGPLHAQGGVMINAEGGEAVMTRGAVTMFQPLLSMMNQMGGGTSFTSGAVGGARPDAPLLDNPSLQQQPTIMKTYVVSNELTTEAERQARLKDLSTL